MMCKYYANMCSMAVMARLRHRQIIHMINNSFCANEMRNDTVQVRAWLRLFAKQIDLG